MKIWLVEDDEMLAESLKAKLKRRLPEDSICVFGSASEAIRGTGSVDIIILDVAALQETLIASKIVDACDRDAEELHDLHPGAFFILYSGSAQFARAVYDRVRMRTHSVHWVKYFDLREIVGVIEEQRG